MRIETGQRRIPDLLHTFIENYIYDICTYVTKRYLHYTDGNISQTYDITSCLLRTPHGVSLPGTRLTIDVNAPVVARQAAGAHGAAHALKDLLRHSKTYISFMIIIVYDTKYHF